MRPFLCSLPGALLVWSCLAYALDADKLVPVRWPGRPLEVARRAEANPAIPSLDLVTHDRRVTGTAPRG